MLRLLDQDTHKPRYTHTHTHTNPDTQMTCWGVGNDLFCSCYSPHWPYLLFSTDCNFSADLWSAGQSLAQCENTENILNKENVQLRPIFLDCRTKQKYLFHTSGQSHKTRHHIIVCVSKTMFRDRWKIMGGDHHFLIFKCELAQVRNIQLIIMEGNEPNWNNHKSALLELYPVSKSFLSKTKGRGFS